MKVTTIFKSMCLFGQLCFSTCTKSDWSSISGGIFFRKDTLFQIKGVNWFGYETCDRMVHGLWKHPMTWYLDFIKENNFNMIRVPFSEEWVKNNFETYYPSAEMISADPSLQGKTSLEILDKLFDECAKRGIFILLDMHRLRCEAQSHELWYTLDGHEYTAETFFQSWNQMVERYGNHTSFHAIDLLNEPRGLAEWGTNPSTSWNMFVQSAFNEYLPNYDGVIYVEGVDWGHSFAGMRQHPIGVNPSRIVFSPHVYGPSVTGGNTNLEESYLHTQWDDMFGFLVPEKKTCVIGEWGGRYEGADKEWQDKFVKYLLGVRVPGVYWCLNPNSGDTGGLLDNDWTTPKYDKLALLSKLQPTPTDGKLLNGLRRHLFRHKK